MNFIRHFQPTNDVATFLRVRSKTLKATDVSNRQTRGKNGIVQTGGWRGGEPTSIGVRDFK